MGQKNENAEAPSAEQNQEVAVATLFGAPVTKGVTMVCGDYVAKDTEQMKNLIRAHVRAKIARQFNIAEISGLTTVSGKAFFNNVRTVLKLPAVKVKENGEFAETVPDYIKRVKPNLELWLRQSFSNANITVADFAELAK